MSVTVLPSPRKSAKKTGNHFGFNATPPSAYMRTASFDTASESILSLLPTAIGPVLSKKSIITFF